MKILVPTDFSECADYALDFAIQLVKLNGGSICLFHAASLSEDLPGINDDSHLLERVKEAVSVRLLEKFDQTLARFEGQNLDISTKLVFGDYLDSVLAFDESQNFDLMVVGSYGASGKREWFIGSNTQKLVRKAGKNIFVIKNPVQSLQFDKVLFPSSLTKEDEKAFLHFLELIEPFGVKEVHILAINTSGWFNQPGPLMLELLKDFKSLVKQYECKTHFYADYSVEAGIRHFSEEHGIKMIGISNMVSSPVKRLFQGSNVEMLVNHSDLPVLAIHF